MTDATVAKLAEVEVLDPAAANKRLGDLWASQPIILAMIRHFG